MSEWQPILTAPRDGTPIILFSADVDEDMGQIWIARWSEAHKWRDYGWEYRGGGSWCYANTPSHWMPLPPPPSTGDHG